MTQRFLFWAVHRIEFSFTEMKISPLERHIELGLGGEGEGQRGRAYREFGFGTVRLKMPIRHLKREKEERAAHIVRI